MLAAVSANYEELKQLEEAGAKKRRAHSAALTAYRDRKFNVSSLYPFPLPGQELSEDWP